MKPPRLSNLYPASESGYRCLRASPPPLRRGTVLGPGSGQLVPLHLQSAVALPPHPLDLSVEAQQGAGQLLVLGTHLQLWEEEEDRRLVDSPLQ